LAVGVHDGTAVGLIVGDWL